MKPYQRCKHDYPNKKYKTTVPNNLKCKEFWCMGDFKKQPTK